MGAYLHRGPIYRPNDRPTRSVNRNYPRAHSKKSRKVHKTQTVEDTNAHRHTGERPVYTKRCAHRKAHRQPIRQTSGHKTQDITRTHTHTHTRTCTPRQCAYTQCGAHTRTYNAHARTYNAHARTYNAHTRTYNAHTRTYNAHTAYTQRTHIHYLRYSTTTATCVGRATDMSHHITRLTSLGVTSSPSYKHFSKALHKAFTSRISVTLHPCTASI